MLLPLLRTSIRYAGAVAPSGVTATDTAGRVGGAAVTGTAVPADRPTVPVISRAAATVCPRFDIGMTNETSQAAR
ncbi:hypothetical protein GCM10027280_01280 [Micromonospora polyrhachis]